MAAGLGSDSEPVIEFGAGTGRLSRGILRAGVLPQNLTLFELDPELAAYLRATLPSGVTCHCAPAQDAAEMLQDRYPQGVAAVISGLPLLSFPKLVCHEIASAAFRLLAPGAPFVQFTYGPNPPLPREIVSALGLRLEKGPLILRNLPPARIYRFRQN